MLIAIIAAIFGYQVSFILVVVLSVATIILPLFAKREHIEKKGEL
jgi:uncharacterized membrane protein